MSEKRAAPKKRDTPAPESDVLPGALAPRCNRNLFGHAPAEQILLDAYRSGRLPHAWIIGGRQGIGKATLAWRMTRFILANPDSSAPSVQNAKDLSVDADARAGRLIDSLSAPDLILLRREWNDKTSKHFTEIRVDDARRTLHMFHHNAASGGWRICIVDAADDLNRASANALLKLIEEPPTKCLFLLIAHQPGRLLPTIRSRCRRLTLEAPDESAIVKAVQALGPPWDRHSVTEIKKAAEAAEGSVRETLRSLDRQGAISARRLNDLLNRLPKIDWSAAQTLIDDLSKPQNLEEYEAFLETLFHWLDQRVRKGAGQGQGVQGGQEQAAARRLAPYAEVWEKIAQGARETDVYNLDKRHFIMATFEDLGAAVALAERR